jgi:hypothetical protein
MKWSSGRNPTSPHKMTRCVRGWEGRIASDHRPAWMGAESGRQDALQSSTQTGHCHHVHGEHPPPSTMTGTAYTGNVTSTYALSVMRVSLLELPLLRSSRRHVEVSDRPSVSAILTVHGHAWLGSLQSSNDTRHSIFCTRLPTLSL